MGEGTALKRVRGLGSAHHGTHHWLLQRFTAAGNLLTVGYLAFSLLLLGDFSYDSVRVWLAQPLPTLAIALLVVSVFWHAKLGLQVLFEDYLHGPGRFAAILLVNLAAFAGAAAGLLFLAQIMMTSVGERTATQAAQNAFAGMTGGGGQ